MMAEKKWKERSAGQKVAKRKGDQLQLWMGFALFGGKTPMNNAGGWHCFSSKTLNKWQENENFFFAGIFCQDYLYSAFSRSGMFYP